MKSLLRWLRLTMSNQFLIVTALSSLVVVILILAPITSMVVRRDISVEFLAKPLLGLICSLAVFFGAIRGRLYHPIFDEGYCKWLASTPWTPNHPLPKGPVHLVWSDLIVVGTLSVLSGLVALMLPEPAWQFAIAPFVLFAGMIALVWTIANSVVGQISHVYAVAAVPVVFAVVGISPMGFILCPFVMAAIAWHGVHRSLATFPWSDLDTKIISAKKSKQPVQLVGWPYRHLLHPADELRTTPTKALLHAALAGGWVWFFVSRISESEPQEDLTILLHLVGISAMFVGGIRLVAYVPVICDKLCWGQRIANKQWIVPRHDQIFLAPLLAALVGWTIPLVLHFGAGLSIAFSCGTAATLVLLIIRGMGPSIRELQLTGVHSKFGAFGNPKESGTIGSSG